MSDPQSNNHTAMDIGALTLMLGSFAGYLPPIAAALGIIWYCVLLYDRFVHGRKEK